MKYTVIELRKIAKERGVQGFYKMNKKQLCEVLNLDCSEETKTTAKNVQGSKISEDSTKNLSDTLSNLSLNVSETSPKISLARKELTEIATKKCIEKCSAMSTDDLKKKFTQKFVPDEDFEEDKPKKSNKIGSDSIIFLNKAKTTLANFLVNYVEEEDEDYILEDDPEDSEDDFVDSDDDLAMDLD